jgi:hypothetical protein
MIYRAVFLTVLAAAVASAPVVAETVLIYLAPAEATAPSLDASRGIDRALEAGVMERLFDEGHIVFDAGGRRESGAGISAHLPRSLLMARNGGADFVLLIALAYDAGEEDSVHIREARYGFYRIGGNQAIRKGVVRAADVASGRERSDTGASAAVGRAIAAELGDSW